MFKTLTVTFISFWVLAFMSPLESFSAGSAEKAVNPTKSAAPIVKAAPARRPASVLSTPQLRRSVANDEAWLTPKNSPAIQREPRWKLMQANPSLRAWSPGGFGDSTGNVWKSKYFQSGSGYHWLP